MREIIDLVITIKSYVEYHYFASVQFTTINIHIPHLQTSTERAFNDFYNVSGEAPYL